MSASSDLGTSPNALQRHPLVTYLLEPKRDVGVNLLAADAVGRARGDGGVDEGGREEEMEEEEEEEAPRRTISYLKPNITIAMVRHPMLGCTT